MNISIKSRGLELDDGLRQRTLQRLLGVMCVRYLKMRPFSGQYSHLVRPENRGLPDDWILF